MYIRELTVPEFEEFASNNPYNNYHQTLNYALLKAENDYEYEIIGFCDSENIYAAAIVLVKILDGYLYAYIPEGFLIDYNDEKLLQDFTNALYKYYKKEDIVFIKINPPIIIAQIDAKTHKKQNTNQYKVINYLERCGYTKLEDNIYFEAMLPRINAIVNLDDFSLENLSKNTKNKIRKGVRKGLTFEKGDINQMGILHEFTKRKIKRNNYYFDDYYNIFQRTHAVDYFLVSIDYEKYTLNSQSAYEKELKKNEKLNDKVKIKPGTRNINTKMNSDKTLLAYKNDIAIASKYLNTTGKKYIAGALVIKHDDTATILISGYDKTYKDFAPNYFLYYEILKYYQNEFKYMDLNGITGDFSKENKYYGLNQFKLGFKPNIYEYIGEFDLIINHRIYNRLYKKGYLQEEFNNN